LPACLLLSTLGCGLRDYEARIDAQRQRVQFLDDENRLLGGAIVPPSDALGAPAWPFDIFLRLPRQVGTASSAIYQANPPKPQDPQLFRYAGPAGFNVFLAAGRTAGKDTKVRPGEWSIATFRTQVRGALLEYHWKEYKVNPQFALLDKLQLPKITKLPVNERGAALSAIDYDSTAFAAEAFRYDLYFHQHASRQLAVIFQYPSASAADENWKQAMDWSLKTLDVTQAPVKRAALVSRRQFKK
jgi:hypothetical protein